MKWMRYCIRLPIMVVISPFMLLGILGLWGFSAEDGKEYFTDWLHAWKP